jgi:diaminohydroxyphosphoribosylaminopyrimidine deaminase/5-amino-6-(5-phosphoribosylamino)uracil reductase
MRVIVDSQWRTPAQARTLQLPGRVLIAGRDDVEVPPALADSSAEFLRIPAAGESGGVCLKSLMGELSVLEINELQVEAGGTLAGALLEQQLVDEILLYQSPVLLGSTALESFRFGPLQKMEQRMSLRYLETRHVGQDLRYRLKPVYVST